MTTGTTTGTTTGAGTRTTTRTRSEEHTSELQSQFHLVCRLLLEKNNQPLHNYVPLRNDTAPAIPLFLPFSSAELICPLAHNTRRQFAYLLYVHIRYTSHHALHVI